MKSKHQTGTVVCCRERDNPGSCGVTGVEGRTTWPAHGRGPGSTHLQHMVTWAGLLKPAPCRCSQGQRGTGTVSDCLRKQAHGYSLGSNCTLYFPACQGEKRTTASMRRYDGNQEPTWALVEDVYLEWLSQEEASPSHLKSLGSSCCRCQT